MNYTNKDLEDAARIIWQLAYHFTTTRSTDTQALTVAHNTAKMMQAYARTNTRRVAAQALCTAAVALEQAYRYPDNTLTGYDAAQALATAARNMAAEF